MIINSKCFLTLINALKTFKSPIDVMYTELDLNSYCCTPSLITQRDGFSDIQNLRMSYKHLIK